jgi:hypothetical protein
VTSQAVPGRPPAHDLSAFDLSRRSPEQVARSFARWKAQRKRQAEAGPARADPLPSPQPAGSGDAAPGETKRASAKQASVPRYSAPFSDLLAAGSEPTVQRTVWTPVAALRPPQRTASPGRRLKVMSILAGAASVFALAGGALLELADWRDPAEVAPQVVQVRPKETPMALAAAATSVPAVDWTLQHTVDVALMKAAPEAVRPTPEPPTPAIQTASKTVPVAGAKPIISPEPKSVAPKAAQFVAKPYVPNVAPTPARSPAAQAAAPVPAPPVAAAVHVGDPRPDDLFQHGRDHRNGTVSNRTVNERSASGGKPAAATGMGSAVDARSGSARNGTATSAGSVDPRGEGSGGARIDGEVGTPSDASSGGKSGVGDGGANGGGSSAGAADGGNTPGASAGNGGTGGTGAGGGDTSGAGAGDGSTGGTDTGGGATGGDESGDASEGGSGESDAGEDGESGGIGGAVEGALGAVGGAVGGALGAVGDALGGGKGNPDSNDKDERN